MTELTRLTDSGFILDHDGTEIAFDVGEYCDPALLAGRQLAAAVFSHEHTDHCDITKLEDASVTMAGPAALVHRLREQGASNSRILQPGAALDIAGFAIEAIPVDHGSISKPIENNGLLITTPAGERIWFAGDIRVDTTPKPSGAFDLVVVPVGGEYVFDASDAFDYVHNFPGEFTALGVHYDYAVEQADAFVALASERVQPVVLEPGAVITIGGS